MGVSEGRHIFCRSFAFDADDTETISGEGGATVFRRLGSFISQWWVLVLGCWLAAFITLRLFSPRFEDLAKGGEFVFLPADVASRQAESQFNRAFPGRRMTSSMVIVVRRDEESGLTDADRHFIDDKLKPAVEQIRDRLNSSTQVAGGTTRSAAATDTPLITDIHTYSDRGIGELLVSHDRRSSLVTIDLSTDFQDSHNWPPVQSVAKMIDDFAHSNELPNGLQLALTGSATLGRDLSFAEKESAKNIGPLTIAMVVLLLIVIYRAPLLALVPLLTLFVAVDVSLHLLTLLAAHGYVPLFRGLQVYTTVISYGPGIDYCLFLIARYKENLLACVPSRQALADAVGQVGAAIMASGATVICGIGMLTFAQFGKFHEAGIGISIALMITLAATLTLTPALLFLTGHWAFWPKSGIRFPDPAEPGAATDDVAVQTNLFQPLWTYMGEVIGRHSLSVLVITLGAMLPFVALGVSIYGNVNYGLLESLPKSAQSASGAVLLEKDFPAGIVGPIQVLLQNPQVDFREEDGVTFVSQIVAGLMKQREQLKIVDIRSVSGPLGTEASAPEESSDESFFTKAVERTSTRRRGVEHYVSTVPELEGHATEMDILLSTDPFSTDSVRILDQLTSAIQEAMPKDQRSNTTIAFVGPTASVRDLNLISQSDHQRIFVLVVVCVLFILIALLRTLTVSLYLMGTVLLSYIATLGVTWYVFSRLDPHGFVGLDWTVSLFLFVVLIAVGEDYNIFLVTRIRQEQQQHGPQQGVIVALALTGGIITSCGFIMAGTFSSLCFGSLVRLQQLGFALAFGVLLDTFVVRPILVPAFLLVLNDQRYGNLSRYLK